MKNKRKGRVIAIFAIVLLVGAIFGIIKLSNVDKYAGLVKVKNASLSSISTKLSANISDLTEDNEIYTKGFDEVEYVVKYRLSQVPGDRDVIINGKVDENDPYASFKEVTGENITSVLSADRKEITVTLKNLPADEEITSKLILLIENAPRGYTVSPKVRIKESTSEEYTNIAVKSVTVNTNSLQGLVIDEDGNKVPNILISLKKNEEIIKETYTNSEGIYTFSDITSDTYKVVVNEEIYENLEVSDLYIEEGNILNLIVKRVYPYKIETNKYITKVELNNLGSSKDYLYDDVELANIPVKRVNNLHGKVYYKIVVQNVGEKEGIVSSVKDELPEGLSFDEKLNSGYELKNGIIYNRNIEGKELKAGERIEDTLVLTIENTDIAKTYINKVNARGELYEHVVYLLNGKQYKTLDVLEGEQLDKLEVSNPNFKGWYTDEKLTNLYNYDNPVEKDLILYGVTSKKHKVIFNDKHPETGEITKYDEQEVPNGETADEPDPDPEKEGYTFCGWLKDDNTKWDFNTPVTSDLTLESCYKINEYTVEFYDNSMNDGGDFELIRTLTKEYKSVLSNSEAPVVSWEGHNFLKWTTDREGQNAYDFTKQIKNNIKLYAQYTLQDRLFIFNDENRITEKTVEYGGTVQAIADKGKEGHTFKYWSLTNPSSTEEKTPFDFATRIYQTTTVYAIYERNVYDVVFNDVDPVTDVPTEYDRQRVPHGDTATEPDPDPEKEGYTFCGWMDGNTLYDFDTPVTGPKTLTSCYEAINLTVRFMDGENLYEQKTVQYGNTVSDTDTHPTKEHNIFKYWSEDNINGFDYSTLIKQNKTLYSVYEEILPPVISHTPLYWTNDKVIVTIESPNSNYGIKYKVDDGSYQDYNGPFELETNSTIVAKSIYGEAESVITSHEVTNIDKLNPTIGTITTAPTQNSITLSGVMTDAQSGIQIINIYNGNVSSGSVAGTPVNIELRDYTKEKGMNFVATGLEVDTEYTFKVEVIDGAGNKSEETITARTGQPDIICQIISVDGVDLNEEDYVPFPLLASAIADSRCDSKCTIQMLKNTTESVSILDTQDITLDLNGKTVSGVLPGYTVQNNGQFTLIDHATEAGGLINGNGIALLNTSGSKLIIGEGSSEPPTGSDTRVVSTTVPYVFGETYGVYTEHGSEFAFFDGKIKGTNAVQGEVTETEYAYNATSGTEDGYESVTLAKLDDPEARINKSVYYSNVANAVGDTNIGTNEGVTTPATFLSGFSHEDENTTNYQTPTGQSFIYDAENDRLISTNTYYGSKAFTETIVDLTDYDENQILQLIYEVTKNSDGTTGEAQFEVYELDEHFNKTTRVYNVYGLSGQAYKLTKGKKYKVSISFTQPVLMTPGTYNPTGGGYNVVNPTNISNSQLIITSGVLYNEQIVNPDYTEYNGTVIKNGFYYDEQTKTIRSDNQFISGYNEKYAYSYLEVDLTGKTGTYELSVSASIDDYDSYERSLGRVYVSTVKEVPRSRYSSDCLIYMETQGASKTNTPDYRYPEAEEIIDYPTSYIKRGPATGTQLLEGGQKYYINLHFQNGYYGDDSREVYERYGFHNQFVINNIKLAKVGEPTAIDIPNEMVGNAFNTEEVIRNWDGYDYYGRMYSNADEYYDSYVKIDLTDSETDKMLEVDSAWYYYNYMSLYITSNNRGLTTEYINQNKEDMLFYKDDHYGTQNMSYPYWNYGKYPGYSGGDTTAYLLEKGNTYYIHFNFQLGHNPRRSYHGSTYDCEDSYYCGSLLKGLKLRDASDVVMNIGEYNIFTGTVSYDELEEDTNTISLNSSDIPVVSNDYTSYVYDENTAIYSLAAPLPYYGFSYIEFEVDLTQETEAKQYYLYENYNGFSINTVVTTDQSYPIRYNNDGSIDWNFPYDYISSNSYFSLQPGHVYYIKHFGYSYNQDSSSVYDNFRIDNLVGEKTNIYNKLDNVITFNEDVDEVQILKNIQLVDSINIDYNKEVKLDLNGYKISSNLSTPIITNNGKLTILDSDYESQTSENKVHNGILESTAGSVIVNNQNAELTMNNFQMNVNGDYTGIENNGELTFTTGYDSKIYVTARNATGIDNKKEGKILSAYSSLEIVMNFLNQAEQNYRLYTSYDTQHFNTGLNNSGYTNVGGLKISGKNGRGIYNNDSGVLILKTINASVDLNARDKELLYNNEPYQYTSIIGRTDYYGRYVSENYPILDYTIYNNSGKLTITDGSYVNNRVYNGSQMAIINGTTIDYVQNAATMVFEFGAYADYIRNNYKMILNSASVKDEVYNQGELQIYSAGFTGTNCNLTNHGSGKIDSANTSYYTFYNYDNGVARFVNGSSKYISNEGKEVSLNSFSVFNSDTSFESAILNSGILNLEYGVTITDYNKYGILMMPLQTTQNIEFYNRHGQNQNYNETTYKQTELNIGTDIEHANTVMITGKENGVTGPCYQSPRREYVTDTAKDKAKIRYSDGTIEPLLQSDYDQSLCVVNMYSGTIKSTDYANYPSRTLSIPITNTRDDSYTRWSNGLVVSPKQNAIDNNLTSNVAKIGDREFISLQDAVDSITTSDPTTIDVGWYTSVESTVIPEGKNITLNFEQDHNSFIYANDGAIINNGNLKVHGAGNLYVYSKYAIINNGNIEFDGGSYYNAWDYKIKESAILKNNGTAEFNGGIFNQLDIYNTKDLEVNTGDFIGTMIYGSGSESVSTLKGGYFNNQDAVPTYCSYLVSDSTSNNSSGWRQIFELSNKATAVFDGLNTDEESRYTFFRPIAHLDDATIEFRSGKIGRATEYFPVPFVAAENNSNVIFNGGTYDNIHVNIDTSVLDVNGGTLTGYTNGENAGAMNLIYLHGTTPIANIRGGNLSSNLNAIGISDFQKCYNDGCDEYSYRVLIGTKGDVDENNEVVCSKTSPSILGDNKALAKYGTGSGYGFIGFYDGIAKAPTNPPIDTDINEIENDYEIIRGSETIGSKTYVTQYLDQEDLVRNVRTGTIYKSFQKAFNETTNGDVLETLRDFTNTTTSAPIVIPSTSNFTLKNDYLITVNNPLFIENNGTAVFEDGNIYSNVTGNIFVNNNVLTLNNVEIENTKATNNAVGDMLLNKENATLNINGGELSTIQHTIINNKGTLNVDKTGNNNCYDTARIKQKISQLTCNQLLTPINNSGTANIDYMTLQSENYCELINNEGNMKINHSTIDQSSNSIEPNINDGSMDIYIISSRNGSNLEISNSNLIFVPSKATYNRDKYYNTWKWRDDSYIYLYSYGDKINTLKIENTNIDTSMKGVVETSDTYSSIKEGLLNPVPTVTINNSNIHSNSYGIRQIGGAKIYLNDNNMFTRDSIVDYNRYLYKSGNYGYFNYLLPDNQFYYDNSSIIINGGEYKSYGQMAPFTDYVPSAISYSTMCTSGTMDSVSLSTDERRYTYKAVSDGYLDAAYVEGWANGITSIGDLEINDADVIVIKNSDGHSLYQDSYNFYYHVYTSSDRYNTAYSGSNTTGAMSTIYSFGETRINDSTIKSTIEPAYSGDGPTYGAIFGRNNANVVLGEKDGLYNSTLPLVEAIDNVPIKGSIKLYDGKIRVGDSSRLTKNINIDDKFIDKETGYTLTGDRESRYLVQDDIIINKNTNIKYTSIQTAINSASNGDELQLLMSEIGINDNTYTISGKTLSIDLKGYKLYSILDVTNNSSVDIIDSTLSEDSYVNIKSTDSTISIENGNGVVNSYGTSVINITGTTKLPYTINAYDDTVVNASNISYTLNHINYSSVKLIMHNNSIVNVSNSKVDRVELNDNSNVTIDDSQNSTFINQFVNYSTNNIRITSGDYNSIINGKETITSCQIEVSNLTTNSSFSNYGTMVMNNVELTNNTSSIRNSGTATLNNIVYNGNYAGDTNYYIYNYSLGTNNSVLDINGGSINKAIFIEAGYNSDATPVVNIKNGAIINGKVKAGKNATLNFISGEINGGIETTKDSATVNIGTKDGFGDPTATIVSRTINVSYAYDNEKVGLQIIKDSTVNFYDGTITGHVAAGAIKGLVTEIEENYKITVTDNGDDTESAYLTVISNNDPRVAMVNGINYTSLQQAINKSVQNKVDGVCPDITIYLNIELDADLTIADGNSVNIISNGYSISINGYNVPDSITLDGQPIVDPSLSGDILSGIRGMLGIDTNTKDVLVYEMSDGSALSTENHYRLYSYTDGEYKLVDMEKGEEVARYNPGKGLTNMKPIKGRLYLTNLKPGSYKVTDDNASEVTFTINEDGTLSGHVKEYIPKEEKIEATGEAKLIISIQTGIRRVNYMLIAISIIAVLSIMFVLKRKSQNNKNLV